MIDFDNNLDGPQIHEQFKAVKQHINGDFSYNKYLSWKCNLARVFTYK